MCVLWTRCTISAHWSRKRFDCGILGYKNWAWNWDAILFVASRSAKIRFWTEKTSDIDCSAWTWWRKGKHYSISDCIYSWCTRGWFFGSLSRWTRKWWSQRVSRARRRTRENPYEFTSWTTSGLQWIWTKCNWNGSLGFDATCRLFTCTFRK